MLSNKVMIMLGVVLSIVAVTLFIIISDHGGNEGIAVEPLANKNPVPIDNPIYKEIIEPPIEEEQPKTLNIAAVGDIMVHIEQIEAAKTTVDGVTQYDFQPMFAEITPFLQKSDFVIGNLETTIAGQENRGYTGYPEFNSPESLVDALKNAGFDYVSTANNHSLDRREAGVIKTLEQLEAREILFAGTARSPEEQSQIRVVVRNGISIALLSYTYGTNGIPIPQGKEYLVNLIDEQQIAEDIAMIRDQVDFVIVSMHYGNEYHRTPSKQQIDISDKLVAYGADIVLGSHPHVLQPAVWKQREGNDAFVIYSLGNFVSAQRGDYKDNGVIVYLTLSKDQDGKTSIDKAEFLPTYVQKFPHEGKSKFRILAAEKSIKDYQDKNDVLLREFDYNKLQQALRDTTEHLTIGEMAAGAETSAKTFSRLQD